MLKLSTLLSIICALFSVLVYFRYQSIIPIMSLPVVAIAGASGRTGKLTVEAFLSPQFRDRYKEVILLSRNSDYKVEGATVRTYSVDNVEEVLKGVDVVVNL